MTDKTQTTKRKKQDELIHSIMRRRPLSTIEHKVLMDAKPENEWEGAIDTIRRDFE